MITKPGAKKELLKRQTSVDGAKPVELNPHFIEQNQFINDPSRYIAAQCSRRAGKTNGLAIRFLNALATHPKSQCIYLALTRDSARDIMLPVLHEMNDLYNLGCTFTESKLTMTHPNGSKLLLMGADMSNFIKRLKGRKYPAVAIDEAQDFGPHLQSLIDDVLTPSISDYSDGWLALTGTPGPVPQGYFFDVTQKGRFGYAVHKWDITKNPFMPSPGAFIADLMSKREWGDNHPTLLREWRNQWVLDVQSLWVRYKADINHYESLPDIKPDTWTYGLGIDIGFKDSDALAVVAWCDTAPTTYLVEEIVTAKQDLTSLVQQIQSLQKKYDISKMVIDEGGLGKKLAEEMRRRHHIPVQPADKARKQENVEFLNDALRLGKFRAKSSSRFAQDSYLVQIDWEKSRPDKIIIKAKPHSDIIDSVLYIFKESPAYAYQVVPAKPKYGTKEWADAQQDEMWEAAQKHFEDEAETAKYIKTGGYGDE